MLKKIKEFFVIFLNIHNKKRRKNKQFLFPKELVMRDFTKKEQENYTTSLSKLFQKTGRKLF